MAERVFGHLRNFALLKDPSAWGVEAPAALTSQRRKSRRLTTGTLAAALAVESPNASDAEAQTMAYKAMLSHTTQAIVESLTIAAPDVKVDDFDSGASLNFINITSWMGERPVQDCQRASCHAAILDLASTNMAYRDEIYMQVMKQLTDNPSSRSCQCGWELLHHLVVSAPPTPNMMEFVRAFALKSAAILLENPETEEWSEEATTAVLDSLQGNSMWRRVEAVWENVWWCVDVFSGSVVSSYHPSLDQQAAGRKNTRGIL